MNAFTARVATALTTVLLLAPTAHVPAVWADDPTAPVQRFQDALIAAMKEGEAVGFEGRRERMLAMVHSSFDLPAVTRAVIGRHYEGLAAADRDALGERVKRYAVTTLAARFSRYDGERFEPLQVRAADAGTAHVAGRFVSASGSTTDLDYALLGGTQGWRIVNVWFDGVSGTDIQRAEFEVFLRDGGVERLRGKLDELIARLASDSR